MRIGRVILVLIVLVIVAVGAFAAYARRPAIAKITPPSQTTFEPQLVARGAMLASVGNCAVCHTREGGASFAGGLAIPTPFGVVYSTNVTPDPETGIGAWSEEAFRRALREGVDREGNHLYPAFPYDHFTLITDDDIRALYAYLMTRDPVRANTPENQLRLPFNLRPLLAGWNLLFLRQGPFQPDPSKPEDFNRGAYLVEALGHCGSCHTPRNTFGAERGGGNRFAGAPVEGWYAYAINADSPAPIPWTAETLTEFLKNGWTAQHGMARGPMVPVVSDLGVLPDDDIRAMATFLAAQMGTRQPAAAAPTTTAEAPPLTKLASADSQALPGMPGSEPGAAIYAAACASCHESGRGPPFGGLNLALSTAIHGPNPKNLINVVLFGIPPAEGQPSGNMPGFGAALSDKQLTDLVTYLRQHFAVQKPAWMDVPNLIAQARAGADRLRIYAADGTAYTPAEASRRTTPQ